MATDVDPSVLEQLAKSPWLRQPLAVAQGYSEGYNRNKSVGPNAPDVPGGDIAAGQYPTWGAGGQALGALAGGTNTAVLSPQTMLKHVVPEALGGDSGHAFRDLTKPDVLEQQTKGSSPDSKLGAQTGTSAPLGPPPGQQQGGTDIVDVLSRLRYGGNVPMQHMDESQIRAGAEQQQKGLGLEMEANRAEAGEAMPVNKQAVEAQKAVTDQAAARMDRDEAQGQDFMGRSAMATQRYEAAQIDPEHYWNSMETPDRIWKMASMIIGAGGAGVTHGPNYAAERINQEIQRDTEAQLKNREAHMTAAKQYDTLAGIAHTHFDDAMQAGTWMSQQKANEAASLLKYIGSKYADPKIQGQYEQAAGALLAKSGQDVNAVREKENAARVESAKAGALQRQANTQAMQIALEAQKFKQNEKARTVTVDGHTYEARSPEEAIELNKQAQAQDAARRSVQEAQGAVGKVGLTSMPGEVNNLRATLSGVIANLPEAQRAGAQEALNDPRIGNNAEVLTELLKTIEASHGALLGRLGAPGGADPSKVLSK